MSKGGSHLKPKSSSSPRRSSAGTGGRHIASDTPQRRTAPAPSSADSFEIIEQRLAAEQQAASRPRRQPESADAAPRDSHRQAPRRPVYDKEELPHYNRRPAPADNEAPHRTHNHAPAGSESPHRSRRPTPAENAAPPRRNPPRKSSRRRGSGAGLRIAIIFIVAVMVFSLYKLGSAVFGYADSRATYNKLQTEVIVPRLPETETETETDSSDAPPPAESEVPFDVDWQLLQDANSDVIAWLYCPSIESINYPVVQATDNSEYLHKDFNGDENAGGTLFADFNSVIGLRSSHLIIYGHNMKDNSMFGKLKNYLTWEFYEENPIFYLLTPDQDYRIELLDCQTISATTDNYPTYFSAEGTTIYSYIAKMTSGAYWVNQAADYESYQLVTMSTCTSASDERLILQGVLVPIE